MTEQTMPELTPAEAKFMQTLEKWDGLHVYYDNIEWVALSNALEARGLVSVDSESNNDFMVVALPNNPASTPIDAIQLPPFVPGKLKFFNDAEFEGSDGADEPSINLALIMLPDDSPLATASYAERKVALTDEPAPLLPSNDVDARHAEALREYYFAPRNSFPPAAPECEYCSAPPHMPHLKDCPTADPRDVKIAALEDRIAKLEKALEKLERRASREADFEDWKSSRHDSNGTFW